MTKRLVNGYFSSVPLAQILMSTVDDELENEDNDDPSPVARTGE